MRIRDAAPTLRQSLEAAGYSMDQLEPWEAWKAFKEWLRLEIVDGLDTASVQFLPQDPDDDPGDEAVLAFVRQFTQRQDCGEADELIGRVVLELRYPAAKLSAHAPFETWSLDFPLLEEWVSVVEGIPGFQHAMSLTPLFTDVFYEDGV